MDIDEAKEMAAEVTLDTLISGKDFKGLGPLARYLVIAVAGPANENAQFTSKETTRTPDAFAAMQKQAQQNFVSAICGFGDERKDPITAAHDLVEFVWWAYINWAKEALENPEKAEAAKVRG